MFFCTCLKLLVIYHPQNLDLDSVHFGKIESLLLYCNHAVK